MRQGQDGCLFLDTPVRALSRAADSACDLYVRGMSGCASRLPAGAVPGGRGVAFGRSAMAVYQWASSDRGENLVRAVAKQRRVAAPEPLDTGAAKIQVPPRTQLRTQMRQGQDGYFCLDAPVRALSRAADSACDLYVRGMSRCASRLPAGSVPGGRGAAFGRSATTVYQWASSDRREDLVRVAAPEPLDVGAAKMGRLGHVAPAPLTSRRRAPTMETIAEDAPCEFGACALRPPELRMRGAATVAAWFGVVMTGSEIFARQA